MFTFCSLPCLRADGDSEPDTGVAVLVVVPTEEPHAEGVGVLEGPEDPDAQVFLLVARDRRMVTLTTMTQIGNPTPMGSVMSGITKRNTPNT